MIIVEGPDGGGKTNLVNRLHNVFEIPVVEKVVNNQTTAVVPDLARWVEDDFNGGLKRKIYDRHAIISEPIYSTALRYEVKRGFNSLSWLASQHAKLQNLGAFIVYCLPSLTETRHNVWHGEADNEVVRDKIDVIWSMYASNAMRDIVAGRAILHNYEVDPDGLRAEALLGEWLRARDFSAVRTA